MPEILKHPDGGTNWVAIFSAIAAGVVLILQQWQTYKLSEIKMEAEANRINYLSKKEVAKLKRDLDKKLSAIEKELIILKGRITHEN